MLCRCACAVYHGRRETRKHADCCLARSYRFLLCSLSKSQFFHIFSSIIQIPTPSLSSYLAGDLASHLTKSHVLPPPPATEKPWRGGRASLCPWAEAEGKLLETFSRQAPRKDTSYSENSPRPVWRGDRAFLLTRQAPGGTRLRWAGYWEAERGCWARDSGTWEDGRPWVSGQAVPMGERRGISS